MSERAISTVMVATGSVRIDAGYVGTKTVKEFTASTNMKIVGFLMYYGQDSPLVGPISMSSSCS